MFVFAYSPERGEPVFKSFTASNQDEALQHFDCLLIEHMRTVEDHNPATASLLNNYFNKVHSVSVSRYADSFVACGNDADLKWYNLNDREATI